MGFHVERNYRNADGEARTVMRRRLERALAVPQRVAPVAVLRQTQRCPVFEQLRVNRLVMGAFRQGDVTETARRQRRQRNVEEAIARLQGYLETGNREALLDAANFCEIEWMLPSSHPQPYFAAVDDGRHVEVMP